MTTYSLHLYLWLLTGRADNFVSDGLKHNVSYRTLAPSDAVAASRQLLALGSTTSDFSSLGAIAAAYASIPALRELPSEQSVMFSRGLTNLQLPYVTGASVVQPDSARWANLRYHPTSLPAAALWTVKHAGDHVQLINDVGLFERLPLRSIANVVYLDLQNILSRDTAVGFAYVGVWTTGASFTFFVPPSRYPYQAVAEKVRLSSAALGLMSQQGTLEAFANSFDAVRKVGALCAAIMLAVYRETRAAGINLTEFYAPTGATVEVIALESEFEHRLLLDGYPLSFESAALLLELEDLIS